ncbi:hypothetical protein [Desulfofundulus thermosubterraneus]|uniref:Uncharacterized protein n=1 Tax=Desulfofundulus thermosubterraneus DSM 16057 TaxID=1121432 RepID=A0A1M6J8V4_9FIRM|nr:hypothetical protein [Desulfofundulus thermosubterraneus]SHJ43119.1 hypothetical protein SAMN02745219_02535 [Desulfofundulus thermosubterraneus DSM 16057]
MKVFKELSLIGKTSNLEALMSEVTSLLDNGWSRDTIAENKFRKDVLGDVGNVFCISAPDTSEHPGGQIWLMENETGVLSVTNIVPTSKNELSMDEYNAILDEFFNRYISSLVDKHRLRFNITPGVITLEDITDEKTVSKLRLFSRAANKSTGSSHPLDKKRWFDFIISAHINDSSLSTDMLIRWLTEVEGWADEMAHELAIEYEYGRTLLEYYDKAGRKQ